MNPRDILLLDPVGRMLLRVDSLGSVEELESYRDKMNRRRKPEPGEIAALAAKERELRAVEARGRR